MIIFLDIEHPKALEDTFYRAERAQTMEQRRTRFEELSNERCEIQHYSDFRAEELWALGVTGLVTSGNRSLWQEYDIESDFRHFKKAIVETQKPVLGICGGHQLIGLLLGGTAEPLRALAQGEIDLYPEYAPGFLKEWGYYPVVAGENEVLFAGLGRPIVVKQMHFWHLSSLPPCLVSVAYNENCPVQALRHRELPVHGVQFHPEYYDEVHIDGREMLRNFFTLSRKAGRTG